MDQELYLGSPETRVETLRKLIGDTGRDHADLRANSIPEDIRERIALEYLSLEDIDLEYRSRGECLKMVGLITRIRLLNIHPEKYEVNRVPEKARQASAPKRQSDYLRLVS